MAEPSKQLHVLLIPYPTQGHMLPLLDLAHLLASRFPRLTLTVAVTPANLPLLSPLLAASPAVKPLVVPFPVCPALPQGIEHAQGLPVTFFGRLCHALAGLAAPLLSWARAEPDPPAAVISDFFMGWTHRLATELGVPRVVFCPSNALTLASLHFMWRNMPRASSSGDPHELIHFDSLPGSPSYKWLEMPHHFKAYEEGNPICDSFKDGLLSNTKSWGFVFNTFSELESAYLDHLRDDLGHERIWAVGPLPPLGGGAARVGRGSVDPEELLAWLDGCEEGSVVYVCFGSQDALPPKQATSLAEALERSGARFLWCVTESTSVPEGFEERTAGRGRVARGWAPQLAVLRHRAVGSFVTHCGWNSVLESLMAGVPMVAWPMGADQFFDARLLEDEGVATRACEGGAETVPDPDDVGRVIAESVGETGRIRRARTQELAAKAKDATREGGSSYVNMERMVEALFGAANATPPSATALHEKLSSK